jgi:hypothetical protein
MNQGSLRITTTLLCAFLGLLAPPAAAQALDQTAMGKEMDAYFDGERGLGLAGMIAGGASIGGAAVLYFQDDKVLEGAAYPLAGFGLLELAAGSVIFFRTPGQLDDLESDLERDPVRFRKDELRRMKGVNDQFDILTIVWVVGIAAGLGTATYGFLDDSDRAKGIGAGVVLESALLLTGDLIAASNARDYTDALERFQPATTGSSSATLVRLGGTF